MCTINNHEETPKDHLSPFGNKPKVSSTKPQFYIDKTLEDLKNRLKYYQSSYDELIDEISLLPDHDDWDGLDDPLEVSEIESDLMAKLSDNSASMYWIEDQIATLQHLQELF